MGSSQFVALLLCAMVVFWVVGAVSRLKRLRQSASDSLPTLLSHLQRRHDWAGRLAEALRPEVPHAAAAFDRLLAARSQAAAALALVQARPLASGPINSLTLAEHLLDDAAQPLLQHLEPIESAQSWIHEWRTTHRQLATARAQFNEAAQHYNQAIAELPTRVVATLWRLMPVALLDAPPTAAPASGSPS